jgi:hypothetical protein
MSRTVLPRSGSLAVVAAVATLAGCGSPTGVPGLFVRVGGEYDLTAVFTTTYDCDPLASAPRDSLTCGSETGVVTTQVDTLGARFAISDFCDDEGCLNSYGAGRFSGSGHATWSRHDLRPDPASTVHDYPDLTVRITPYVIDCSADNRRRPPNVDPLCAGHEQETLVVVWVELEPLGVWLGQGLQADRQVAGALSDLTLSMQPPRFSIGTTWTLR